MPKLAAGRQHSRSCAQPCWDRQPALPRPRCLAPGSQLAAIPRLDKDHGGTRIGFGSAQAVHLAQSLVSLGVADRKDWEQAGKDPMRMAKTVLERLLEEHGNAVVAAHYELELRLGQSLFDYGTNRSNEIDPTLLFFSLSPCSSFPVCMGKIVDELETVRPGLGVAAYRTLQNALYRWVRVYDDSDARQYIDTSMESIEEGEEDQCEIPKLDPDLPACLRTRKSSWRQSRQPKLPAYPLPAEPRLRQIVELVRQIHRASHSARRPDNAALLDELRQSYSLDVALPVVVLHFRDGDAISACFDFEAEFWGQETPEPNLVLSFHPDNPEEVKACLKVLAVVTGILALIVELSDLLRPKEN